MAFDGLATYDNMFANVAEDVSAMIGQISPYETPLLDRLSTPERPAFNVLHEWMEDQLNPKTITTSTAGSTSGTAIAVHVAGNAVAPNLTLGSVWKDTGTGEYVQITASAGNTITITRAFGGTSAADLDAGSTLFHVTDVALEGSDVSRDISRARSRKTNYAQIFKKDVIVSGTMQAMQNLGNVGQEYTYQLQQRMKETLRDLETAVILGKLSGNTLGSDTAFRTMKGLWDFLATNSTSTGTMTASVLENVIQNAWSAGGTPNLIIADATWKREIDSWNSTRVQVNNSEATYRNKVTQFEGTFGMFDVILGRWMPTRTLMVLDTSKISVVPLRGRTFQHIPAARTGDSEKGMIIGEYTLEVKNEDGMAKAYG